MVGSDIKVMVAGAAGKLGGEVCRAVEAADGMTVVVVADPAATTGVLEVTGAGAFRAAESVAQAIEKGSPDVMVDFTHPKAVRDNVLAAVRAGVHCVVGTTGLTPEALDEIAAAADEMGVGCFVAPNFAIGAVLMMRLAETAAKWMPAAEVIELHHDQKADAPSGTAKMTAARIAAARDRVPKVPGKETETVAGVRGGDVDGVPVHSVRLPGLVAHQEVLFGGPGQVLSIRHDSTDRTSFMPGVVLAVRHISEHPGLTVGLEKLLGI